MTSPANVISLILLIPAYFFAASNALASNLGLRPLEDSLNTVASGMDTRLFGLGALYTFLGPVIVLALFTFLRLKRKHGHHKTTSEQITLTPPHPILVGAAIVIIAILGAYVANESYPCVIGMKNSC